jgi:hypothetical protein
MSERKGEMIEMRPSGGGRHASFSWRRRAAHRLPRRLLTDRAASIMNRCSTTGSGGRQRRAPQRDADLERGGRSGRLPRCGTSRIAAR